MASRVPGATVLLVDDDYLIREVLEEILVTEGFKVVCASNGAEALERLPELTPPCVVLLDLMMPVMNGRKFLERFHQEPAWREIPIVMMSASSLRPHPMPERVKGWLTKPAGIDEIVAAIKRVCGEP